MQKYSFTEIITCEGEPVCSYYYDLGSFYSFEAAEAAMIEEIKEHISWPNHNHKYVVRAI